MYSDFVTLAHEAAHCRACFRTSNLKAPTIDVAQPRWVGVGYWKATTRVLIVLLNPGSGEQRDGAADAHMSDLLRTFRDNPNEGLERLFEHQSIDMPNWGRHRFQKFVETGLGLNLDEVALANVAWCATSGNKYPSAMLNECFDRFTSKLVRILSPMIILLCGSKVARYEAAIRELYPAARCIRTMHYAHREGKQAEQKELQRVRDVLGQT